MNDPQVEIQQRPIGAGHPPYIVAELSANHGNDLDCAIETVRAAARAGAHAIKLQTYTADTMTIDCDAAPFQIPSDSLWAGRSLYELYQEASTPWAWHAQLKQVAEQEGLQLFSSPFDATAVDFLEDLGVPAYKIASFELNDHPLLRRVGATGKPVILSTGMGRPEEIDEAVGVLRAAHSPVVLLHCTSAYPAPADAMQLATIPALAQTYALPIGLSDHTLGSEVALAATALGACMIEKHFILDRAAGGPDATFSIEPDEFRRMVDAVTLVHQSIGEPRRGPSELERANIGFRRSLFVTEAVAAGVTFNAANLRAIRPGDGLSPKHLDELIGRRAARDIPRGTPMAWDLVADD